MKNLICSLLLISLFSACTGVPYRPDKPISLQNSFVDRRVFNQENKEVKYNEVRAALADDPKTSSLMTNVTWLDIGGRRHS